MSQKHDPQAFPEIEPRLHLALTFLKKPAVALLYLVDQEGQHHQVRQYRTQVLIAVAEVVLEVIALVLQGVEGLVFYFPPRPTTPHYLHEDVWLKGQIGDPAEVLGLARRTGFPEEKWGHIYDL